MNVNYLLLAALAAPMVLGGCNIAPKNSVSVSSFEMCEQADGEIMESHPRQCRYSDMVFVEDLEKEILAENSIKAFTGEIVAIENGKDGYSVTLKSTTEDTKGELVKSVLSIPNLGPNSTFDFDAVKKGNIITVVGDSFMLGDEKNITARTAFVGDSIPVEPNGGIGDGAESLDTILQANYIGKTEIEAAALAKKNNVPFRVVERDGKTLPTTRDFRIGRINAVVENGKVVSYKVEGGKRAEKEIAVVGLANPASTFCVEQGGKSVIETDKDGGQYGNCVFSDGKITEEWEFFRSKNQPYLNKTVQEAEALARQNGVQFRITEKDGELFGITMDIQAGRINAVVKKGKVVSYHTETLDGIDSIDQTESLKSTTEILNIGPKKVECLGAFPQECYIVDGGYFYDGITGFEFEAGYEYKIKVKKTPRCDLSRPANCPQDVGVFKYDFIEEISKTKVTEVTDYIGLTETESVTLAKKNGVMFRVIEREGQMLAMTMDLRPGRINAVVKNGKVASFQVE